MEFKNHSVYDSSPSQGLAKNQGVIPLKAVLLDAVGTTIYPAQDVSQTYFAFGNRHGSRLVTEDIQKRFWEAFQKEDEVDRLAGHVTSEEREKRRWQTIVTRVFEDVGNAAALFQELWEYFRNPSSWRVFPEAVKIVEEMRQSRVQVVLASNFDARLRHIVHGLPELAGIERLAISSELGWKKPAREFYCKIVDQLGIEAHEVMSIGDDYLNDVQGAIAAGLQGELIKHLPPRHRELKTQR